MFVHRPVGRERPVLPLMVRAGYPRCLCLAEACQRRHLVDSLGTRAIDADEADIHSDGLQSGVVESEYKMPRVPKGHPGRLWMNGLGGTQLREPGRVQYLMELVMSQASARKPVSVQRFIVWEPELH
jgi:hypothetical protein